MQSLVPFRFAFLHLQRKVLHPVLHLHAITSLQDSGTGDNEAPKVQMPRWNETISTKTTIHQLTADACIQDLCTAVCFSYAIRSQSVLTTNSTGRVYNVQFDCRAQHSTARTTSEIASIACLHSFFRHTLLSCNLSASRQSTVDSFVYGEL